jgi:hypothetical protein
MSRASASATVLVFGILAAACAGARPPAAPRAAAVEEPAPVLEEPTRQVEEPDRSAARPDPMPTTCASDGTRPTKDTKVCMVGADYAKKLCAAAYPEMPLAFFMKGTPWTRAYLKGDVEAWNASGGHTTRTKLAFDEEVIVLARHGAAAVGGVVMSGAQASYDVLRWDGTCVSISEGEMTMNKPPTPKVAPVAWRRLDDGARKALLESPKVKGSQEALEKACASGDEKSCEAASKALSASIANHVRGGAVIVPSRLP